jgi:hypothetical protein
LKRSFLLKHLLDLTSWSDKRYEKSKWIIPSAWSTPIFFINAQYIIL